METNEKYLSGSMKVSEALYKAHKAIQEGKEYVNFVAFKQKTKEKETHPDYRGDCSIWVREKKPSIKTEDVV